MGKGEIIALAEKHGVTSYRHRTDTVHHSYGFSEAQLTAFVAEVSANVAPQRACEKLHQIAEPACALFHRAIALAESDELAADWRKEPAAFAPVLRACAARVKELEHALSQILIHNDAPALELGERVMQAKNGCAL